jgi:hypothetical protein
LPGSKPAQANSSREPISKKPFAKKKKANKKRIGGVVQGAGPEFNPQYPLKKEIVAEAYMSKEECQEQNVKQQP